MHHGIPGQEWGKRNGPPYPLSRQQKSQAEKEALAKDIHERTKAQKIKSGTYSDYARKREKLYNSYSERLDFYKKDLIEIGQDLLDARVKRDNLFNEIKESNEFVSKADKYIDHVNKERAKIGVEPVDGYDFRLAILDGDTGSEGYEYLKWLAKNSSKWSTLYKEINEAGREALKNRKECSEAIIEDIIGEFGTIPAKIPTFVFSNTPKGQGHSAQVYKQVKVKDFIEEVIKYSSEKWALEQYGIEYGKF